jgi:hypothetical protein
VRLPDKAGDRDGLMPFVSRIHFISAQNNLIGDCEPPCATGQEMTITKVTN